MILKFPHRLVTVFALSMVLFPNLSHAKLSGNAEVDAKVLYQRLTGLPLRKENPLYNNLVSLVQSGQLDQAAASITNPQTGSVAFYEGTVRNISSTFNRYEASIQDRLNDFMALFIGIVRDSDGVNVKVDDLLLANYLYNDPTVAAPNNYSPTTNTHFDFISKRAGGFARQLVKFVPTDYAHVGAYDTRAFGQEFAAGGTLRRNFESMVQLFFAVSQKSVMMPDLPSDQYRRDFPLTVAGLPVEMNQSPLCIGCHRGMDGVSRVFLDRHWNGSKIVLTPSTDPLFDQVNEENRPDQKALSTVGKLYVTKDMNEKVFGYQGLNSRGNFLEADLADMKSFMNFVVNARGFHRGMAKRIAFYMFTGRLFILSDQSADDGEVLKAIQPQIDQLADSLSQHRNLRKTFEEAAVLWMKY